jgi:pimeloyl-ACP methyl ester carboxylesterase
MLDAAVPPAFTWPTFGARDAEAALETLIADCEASSNCSQRYPSFRRDVDAAFATLNRRAVPVAVMDPLRAVRETVTFGASDLAYATRGALYGADALRLPHWFRLAATGDYTPFAQAYVTRARTLGREIATGVHLGVYCAEDVPYLNADTVRRQSAQTRLGTFLLDEYVRACEVWPRATIPSTFRDPVRSSVPALIMTGRRDPVTPPRTAHEVAATLSRARVVTWPAGGHGFDGLQSSGCKERIIREFIATADPERLSTTCATTDTARQD